MPHDTYVKKSNYFHSFLSGDKKMKSGIKNMTCKWNNMKALQYTNEIYGTIYQCPRI